MTYEPEREARAADSPKSREISVRRSSGRSVWMAALAIAVLLGLVGYFFLEPDVPSPNMRASDAPVTAPTAPPAKSN